MLQAPNKALHVLNLDHHADLPLADVTAQRTGATALGVLDGQTEVEVLIFDRRGGLVGRADG